MEGGVPCSVLDSVNSGQDGRGHEENPESNGEMAHSLEMTEDEIKPGSRRRDREAAQRARVAPLSEGRTQHLFDIYLIPGKFVGVESGRDHPSLDAGRKPMNIGVHLGRTKPSSSSRECSVTIPWNWGMWDYSWKQG